MRRILWLLLALVGLLAAACGSADEESTSELERDGLPGEAPPVATSTATARTEATPVATVTSIATAEAPAGDLGDRLDEMTLDEDDVPRGLTSMGEMTLDYDMENLGLGPGSGKAHMTMFAGAGQQEMVVSMVILFEDSWAVEQALAQMDKVSTDQIQDAFGMMGDFGGLQYDDLRELDVSDLGEGAFAFAMKFELPQIGAGDGQWVFFGRDSLLAMVMTMGMSGGAAADAVPLAEVMDGKIKNVILQ